MNAWNRLSTLARFVRALPRWLRQTWASRSDLLDWFRRRCVPKRTRASRPNTRPRLLLLGPQAPESLEDRAAPVGLFGAAPDLGPALTSGLTAGTDVTPPAIPAPQFTGASPDPNVTGPSFNGAAAPTDGGVMPPPVTPPPTATAPSTSTPLADPLTQNALADVLAPDRPPAPPPPNSPADPTQGGGGGGGAGGEGGGGGATQQASNPSVAGAPASSGAANLLGPPANATPTAAASPAVPNALPTSPLQLVKPADQTSKEGDSVALAVRATSPSGATLTYQAVNLPPGIGMDSAGNVSGTIAAGAAGGTETDYVVNVFVQDEQGNAGAQSFTWAVTGPVSQYPPNLVAPDFQNNSPGDVVSVPVTASHPEGLPIAFEAENLPPGTTIDPSSGLISGTIAPEANAQPLYDVVVRASAGGQTSTVDFQWAILDSAPAPLLGAPGDQVSALGDVVSFDVSGGAAGTVNYAATSLPAGLAIGPADGIISGTVSAPASAAPSLVTVTATDGTNSASASFNWVINGVSAVRPNDQNSAVGDSVALPVIATDYAGGLVTSTVSGLPPGLAFDSTTNQITGTIAPTADTTTPYVVTVTATEGAQSDTQTFSWAVSPALTLDAPPDQINFVGDTVSLPLSAQSPFGQPLAYSATGLPPGAVIDSASGLISGTLADGADSAGPYTPQVTVSDGTHTATRAFGWAVQPTLALAAIDDQNNSSRDAVSFQPTAVARGTGLSWSATGLPSGVAIDPATGNVAGTLADGAASAVPYSVTVTVADGTTSASQTFEWSVAPAVTIEPSPDQNSAAGESAFLALRAASSRGADLSYAAQGLPPGLAIDSATGEIAGTVGAGLGAVGSYPVSITASDGTSSATETFAWNVSAVGIAGADDRTDLQGDTVSVQLTGTSASGAPLAWQVTGLPAGATFDPTAALISGTLTAATDGPVAVTATASDGTNTTTQTFEWTVSPRIAIDPLSDRTTEPGQPVSLPVAASSLGGALTYSATGLPPGTAIDPSTGTIFGTIDPAAASATPYAVTVTATDGTWSASRAFAWNVPGLVLPAIEDQSSLSGDSVALPLGARHHGTGTLLYQATGLPAGLTIDPASGMVTGALGDSAVEGGPYQTTVTASDGTFSASQTFAWIVDPAVSLGALGDQSGRVGDAVSLDLSGEDARGAALTYTMQGLPPGLIFDPASGLVTGTIADTARTDQPYQVTVTAGEGTSTSTSTFAWSVAPASATASAGNAVGATSAVAAAATNAAAGAVAATAAATAAASVPAVSWSDLDSPFYGRNLTEAKYRARLMAITTSGDGYPNGAVGDLVARYFGVPATTTWAAFFPRAEYDRLVQQRQTVANALDPRLLAALHQDWLQATQDSGYTDYAAIGPAVAARWQQDVGFEWARAETNWAELYTLQDFRRITALQAQPIPKLPDVGLAPTTAPLRLALNQSDPLLQITYEGLSWQDYLARELRQKLLPRLSYASAAQVGAYVQGLTPAQRLTLRYAVGREIARLTGIVGQSASMGQAAAAQREATSNLALCNLLYSELGYTGASAAYGAQAPSASGLAAALQSLNAGLQSNPWSTIGLSAQNRGSLAQRASFLSDTDYDTFRAREQASGAEGIPTAQEYYASRDRLLQAVDYAQQAGRPLSTAVAPLLGNWYRQRLTMTVKYPGYWERGLAGDKWVPGMSEEQVLVQGVPNPNARVDQFVYDRYLRGAEFSMPVQSYYALDRYNQANMALAYLPGWQLASPVDRGRFADYLAPLDRQALLDSLVINALRYRAAGDAASAQQALAMAGQIQGRFNRDLKAMRDDPLLRATFAAASTAPANLNGLNATLTPAQRAAFDRLAPSVQQIAWDAAWRDFRAWREANPVTVKYDPASGYEFLDRSVLNAADFLAPVYRTAERLIGVGQWVASGDSGRTDQWSDLEDIRRVMGGDFSGQIGPRPLQNDAWSVVLDAGLTALTVIPLGTGSRAAIGGGQWFLPASTMFARRQAASALRHAGVLTLSAASATLAMSAVEVSPLEEKYKGPLRFAAGLTAGALTGAGLSRALPVIESRLARATRQLGRAEEALQRAQGAIGQGGAVTPTQVQGLVDAAKRVGELRGKVDQLRALGGAELVAAEGVQKDALQKVADLTKNANEPGIPASVRQARLTGTDMRKARQALKEAQNKFAEQYNKVDRVAAAQGINVPGGSSVGQYTFPALSEPGQVQTVATYFDKINKSILKLGSYDGSAVRSKTVLNEEQLLLLSRYFKHEVVQIELRDGTVLLSRGKPVSFRYPDQLADVRQVRRITHTHPGEADVVISGPDIDGLMLKLKYGTYPTASFDYRVVSSRTVFTSQNKEIFRPVSLEVSSAEITRLSKLPALGRVAGSQTEATETLAAQALRDNDKVLQRLQLRPQTPAP